MEKIVNEDIQSTEYVSQNKNIAHPMYVHNPLIPKNEIKQKEKTGDTGFKRIHSDKRIFISHSSLDKSLIDELADSLSLLGCILFF